MAAESSGGKVVDCAPTAGKLTSSSDCAGFGSGSGSGSGSGPICDIERSVEGPVTSPPLAGLTCDMLDRYDDIKDISLTVWRGKGITAM